MDHPVPTVIPLQTCRAVKHQYFDSDLVENLLIPYLWGGCTDIKLRDQIMSFATPLIEGVIRTNKLHQIREDGSAVSDLVSIGWVQIERTLYKYKATTHCGHCYKPASPQFSLIYEPAIGEYGILNPEEIGQLQLVCPKCKTVPRAITYRGLSKVFNMWSTIAHTSILATIKSSTKDRKHNGDLARNYTRERIGGELSFARFIGEAKEKFKYDNQNLKMLAVLERLMAEDERAWYGLINKLVRHSRCSRALVQRFLFALQSGEFSDDPLDASRGYRKMMLLSA